MIGAPVISGAPIVEYEHHKFVVTTLVVVVHRATEVATINLFSKEAHQ